MVVCVCVCVCLCVCVLQYWVCQSNVCCMLNYYFFVLCILRCLAHINPI